MKNTIEMAGGSGSSAIDGKLETARRNLLDMSRRNRLLNFRTNRQTDQDPETAPPIRHRVDRRSLAFIGATPTDVYQLLVGDEKTLEFLAADDTPDQVQADLFADDDAAGVAASSDGTKSASPKQQSPRPSRDKLRLQTPLTNEKLDARLLFLAREAESALQEQGCNILYLALGLLEWVDPESDGGNASSAPIILVPVELVRGNANQRFRIRLFDDAPVVNPTLTELCRTNFRLEVPQLDSEVESPLDDLFRTIEQQIAKAKGWGVRREVHLGLFSFAKLLMYLDLDPARWPEGASINTHPLVKLMCGAGAELEHLGGDASLMPATEIDDKVAPQDTFQVMDADSSQQVAILGAKHGTSMVVEGPPGTGKSQTIANIIAECLAAGKTVLFVAEKAAALDVVKRRLDGVGLGDFVLELHSRKAAKRKVLEEMERTLRAIYPAVDAAEPDAAELQRLRNRLNEYVRALHDEKLPLQMSLFEAMGRCAQLRSAPESQFALSDLSRWDRQRLARIEEQIILLGRAATRVGSPRLHPWRGVGLSEIPLFVRQQLPDRLAKLQESIRIAGTSGVELAQLLQATPSRSRKDAQQLLDLVKAILNAPQVTARTAADPAWDSRPADFDAAVQSALRLATLRENISARWQPSAEEMDWSGILKRRNRQTRSLFKWLSPSWHRDTKSIRQHMLPGTNPRDASLPADLVSIGDIRQCRAVIQAAGPRGAASFGPLWLGEVSDWHSLETFAQAAVAIRGLIVAGRFSVAGASAACSDAGRLELKRIAKLFAGACNDMLAKRKEVAELLALNLAVFLGGDPEETSFDAWTERLAECQKAADALQDWIDFAGYQANCVREGIASFLAWCDGVGAQAGTNNWADAFRRQFLRLWLDQQFRDRGGFRDFHGENLDQLADRFRQADKHWLEVSRGRLAALIAARRPDQKLVASKNSKLGILQAELRRKRNVKPLRQLFSLAGDVIQALKPCFMMSPISTAQYLEPGKLTFDVVIFDEASQVEPADALGAIARGRQLILVGDDKQLPPTSFFGSVNAASEEEEGGEDGVKTDDLESILAVGQVCLPVRTRLRWHYRSRHSSLIEFSNGEFYDGELRVFPSPHLLRNDLGLSLRHLPQAVYQRGKGQFNPIEAKDVAEQVLAHAKNSPHRSLGVGAFSMAQQRAIEDEIEAIRRQSQDPAIEAFFAAGEHEPFFVKNLETIQGDERDVIFLSVGYGPDEGGRVMMNFGPLNRDGGWRRLNVLITRAREKCIVFTSLTAAQMRLGPDAPRGVKALKDFLQFAEQGTLPTVTGYRNDHDSPFEADVCRTLRDQGWEVHAQVGCAGFSIDLAIVDPQEPGCYVLGIECDGATYHSAATARDRDRLRQSVLEGLGWRIYRVWSTDWFERRDATAVRLLAKVKEVIDGRRNAVQAPIEPQERPRSAPAPKLFDLVERPAIAKITDGTVPQIANIGQQATTIDAQSTVELESSSTRSAMEPPPGFVPFQRYSAAPRGGRQQLLVSTSAELIGIMADVVRIEGPIHRDELDRVVAGLYQCRTAGQVKNLLVAARHLGASRQQFFERGEFIWPAGMELPPIRWRGTDDAVTDPALICSEEIAQAAIWVTKHQFGIPLDDLPAATLHAIGFRRIGPHVAALGAAGVELAVKSRRIVADSAGFMVAPPDAESPAGP